jgi:hypothetical protein
VLERERCGDFKVFISPFRIVEIMKNPVMELVECNRIMKKQVALNDYQKGGGK